MISILQAIRDWFTPTYLYEDTDGKLWIVEGGVKHLVKDDPKSAALKGDG